MSDFWQGPGWWLASDGKWYPADGQPPGDDASASNAPQQEQAELLTPAPSTAVAVDDDVVDLDDGELQIDEGSGWQAIDTTDDDGYDVSAPNGHEVSTATAASDAPTAEDVFPDDAPAPEGGWEPTEEASESDSTAIAAPVVSADRLDPKPIERNEAWRKPGAEGLTTSANGGAAGAPQVVDLTVPAATEELTSDESHPRTLAGMLLVVALVVSIVALAALIGWLFTRVNDGDTATVPSSSTAAPLSEDDDDQATATSDPADEATGEDASDTSAVEVNEDPDVSVFKLEVGDCIGEAIGEGEVQTLDAVDCAEPHAFEVFRQANLTSEITEFDNDAITTEGERICAASFDSVIPPGDERSLRFKWLQPTPDSWELEENPDRLITCLLFDEDGPLTGRVAQ